ncbi:MAG: chemotaxis protein CheW [Actinomycetota bacterium]|nr:chemotaxis protein CheW [Actinomycetota bacterium]
MSASSILEQTQHCTFLLGDLYLGVEVTRVQEVIRHQITTPVPLASEVIGGLMNLRGEIVTTIDLRRRLGLPSLSDGQDPMHVVIRSDDGVVSLLVDAIGDVIEVDDDAFEPAPPTLAPATRELIVGVYKLDGRLLLVLDCDRVLDLAPTTTEHP